MNPTIANALNHSMKHKNAIAEALAGVARNDIGTAAAIVKDKCEELQIADFPNPWPAGMVEHDAWAIAWNGPDNVEVNDPPAAIWVVGEKEPINFKDFASKKDIADYVLEHTGERIATWSSRPAVEARAQRVLAQHAAK